MSIDGWILRGLGVAMVVAGVSASGRPAEQGTWQKRLADSRPLGTAEIDQLLDAARQAGGGTAFHLAAERGAFRSDILVERDGHVHYIRSQSLSGATFSEFTGRIARYCDGTVASGELVIEYRQTANGWAVAARPSSPADLLRPIFDMLVGLKPLADAGVTSDGGRALSAAWNLNARGRSPGGGGAAAGAVTFVLADPTVSGVETLVIDPQSLLPLRWEFTFAPSGTANRTGHGVVPLRIRPGARAGAARRWCTCAGLHRRHAISLTALRTTTARLSPVCVV